MHLARTGPEALEAIDGDANLLILDFDLPILSGPEVYLELKKRGCEVPTIVLAAQREEQSGEVDTLRKQAISGFFHKPFNIEELIETVQQVEASAA